MGDGEGNTKQYIVAATDLHRPLHVLAFGYFLFARPRSLGIQSSIFAIAIICFLFCFFTEGLGLNTDNIAYLAGDQDGCW